MKLHFRQSVYTPGNHTNDAFVEQDGYYVKSRLRPQMDLTKALVSNSPYPTFLVDKESDCIIYANRSAYNGEEDFSYEGEKKEAVLTAYTNLLEGACITYLNGEWYHLTEKTIQNNGTKQLLLELMPRKEVPDAYTLETWKNMIAVMLHRFRSPLTGITGYLEMVEDDTNDESHKKWLGIVNKGIDHLYTMMDELEELYKIPVNFNSSSEQQTNLKKAIDQAVLSLPDKDKQRVKVSGNTNVEIKADPDVVVRVLEILLSNALEHSLSQEDEVRLHYDDNRCLRVINKGKVIPKEIAETLFHPFVTSKSDNLGIGLTMALLFARQFNGGLFLTANTEDGIEFSLCFPE